MRNKSVFWAVRNCRSKMLEVLADEMPDMDGQIQMRRDIAILAEMARAYDPNIQDAQEQPAPSKMTEPKTV